ncbi:CcdB family protein [Sphingomonas sp.]|jgi:toxin CcdB|uniref:CcdB family protein n=1 Tax=Sphingomonas sp. TaxID=28214 RepID=UPI002DF3E07D|nr:CcdB family protein [Sphingomonas sp.]
MARFDYHRSESGGYVLDCQADLLSHLNTRLVVPLILLAEAPTPAARLNPVFVVDGEQMVMVTQFASAMFVKQLGPPLGSLGIHDRMIMDALDMLQTGF